MTSKALARSDAVELMLDMNIYSAFGAAGELLVAASATGAAAWSRSGKDVASAVAARRGVATDDRDLAAADHDARHRALRLQIEHVDHVAFGAAVQRLAADGEVQRRSIRRSR